jgi:hypothetical protein
MNAAPPVERRLAIKPADNEAFYREVDEELRKEQFNSAFKRYGWLIIAAVVLLLAAIGGYFYWQNQQQVRAGQQGEALVDLLGSLEKGESAGAEERLAELVDSRNPGYRAAAMFTRANLAVERGDNAAAAEALQAIADDGRLAEPYRQAALIRRTQLEYDRLQPAEVIKRLSPLAQEGSPWLGSAGEMVAIAHIKAGRPAEAGPILSAISRDPNVPASIRSRAVQMAGALGVDAVVDAPAAGSPAVESAAEGNNQ